MCHWNRTGLYSFIGLLIASQLSCGKASDSQEIVGETSPVTAEAQGEGEASGVDNASVKDKPLLKACYKGDSFACAVEAVIGRETNALRTASRPLVIDFESSFVARDWSAKQIEAGSISHDGFPYERVKVLKKDFPNASWGFSAENVAMNSLVSTDPEIVGKAFVTMWKNSEGHRKNMLGNYSYLGVGVAVSGNKVYATQIFH